MKFLLTIKGKRLFAEVEETKEVDVEVGCGVRFMFHNTKYSGLGEIVEIDEPGRRIRILAPGLNTWIELEAIRDVITGDDLKNARLQNLIDHGMTES